MRKLFIAVAALVCSLSLSAEVTHSYDEATKTLTFSGEGEMEVMYTDSWGDTYIKPAWSDLKNEVEKVVVNEGVTNVGEQAFMSFENLKEVQLASTVVSIGPAAFEGCIALPEITLPAGLKEIGYEAFFQCKALSFISIPEGVTYLPDFAFQECSSLTHIDLGNVKSYGKNVFVSSGLTSFVIPDGTKVLSECLFMGCNGLKTIDVPACVEKIEYGVFYYCVLDTINFLGETFPTLTGSQNFTNGAFEHTTVIRVNCKAYSQDVVQAIESHGGAYDTKIIPSWPNGTEVYSTSNAWGPLTITPVDCDNNIYKLSVDLWSSRYQVTWEGSYDFDEEDLHATEIVVDLSEPATVIANISSGSVTPSIALSVKTIGMGDVIITEFAPAATSKSYKLVAQPEEGAEFLYWEAYYNEELLTEEQSTNPEIEVTITSTEYIRAVFTLSPYCGKDGGKNIVWKIQNDTLYLTGSGEMEDFDFSTNPPYLDSDEEYRFVKVSEGITSIGDYAFGRMSGVEKIYLPSTIQSVGTCAFVYCEDLDSVFFAGATLPSWGEESYLSYMFYETPEDLVIVVPCDAVEAYEGVFEDMDIVCLSESAQPSIPSVDDFTFDPANVCGAEGDGSNILWAFDEATGTLALKGSGKMEDFTSRKKGPWRKLDVKRVIMSDGITTVGNYAFAELSGLESVALPATLDSIYDYGFADVPSLKQLTLPDGLTYIGQHAFQSLSFSVKLPSTLKTIDEYAFMYGQFSTIEIPESVTFIGHGAFYSNNELKSVVFESETPAQTGGNTFVTTATGATGKLVRIVVPCDAVAVYKATAGYQAQYVQGEYPYTLAIQEISDGVVSDLGGKALIEQWPDCETGEAIAYVFVRGAYEFSHWEATGVTLTEEQAKSEKVAFTVDADCLLSAVFKIKTATEVAENSADGVVIEASEGRISLNRDEFFIYDLFGRDVTSANGALATGVYVVKCENHAYKVVMK